MRQVIFSVCGRLGILVEEYRSPAAAAQGASGRGTAGAIAVIPSMMEDRMCWEMDYYWLAEQKKAEETKAKQEQRLQVFEKLLSEVNKPADKPEGAAPVKETIPAK
jgi:hypothetical protein